MGIRANIIIGLMAELRDLCNENQIPYFLTGWSALSAYGRGDLGDNVRIGQIMIWPQDARRLAKAIEDMNRPDRDVDYLDKNPNFPGFFMKYYAEDTTLFEPYHDKGYTHHGYCVDILFINYLPKSFLAKKQLGMLEAGLILKNGIQHEKLSTKKTLSVRYTRNMIKHKFKGNGKALFDYMLKLTTVPSDQVRCRAIHKPGFEFGGPAALLSETTTYPLGEEQFNMPKNAKEYVSRCYRRYYTQVLKGGIKYPYQYTDSEVPYKELFEHMGVDPTEYIRDREEKFIKWMKVYGEYKEGNEYFNQTWNRLNALNDALLLKDQYTDETIDQIELAYEEGDYVQLYDLVTPYVDYLYQINRLDIALENEFEVNPRLHEIVEKYHLAEMENKETDSTSESFDTEPSGGTGDGQ